MRTKSYLSLLTGLLFSALVLSACSGSGNANNPGTAGDGATTAEASEVTQEDVEKLIIGKWIISEIDGQPAQHRERGIFMRSAGVLWNKGCERLKVQNGKTGHCS